MRQVILLLGALVLTLSACTKSENTLETTDILRTGKWKISAYTVKFQYLPGKDTVYDLMKSLGDCRSDDFLEFKSDYKGIQNTAVKKCGSESTEMPFDWELRKNGKILMINNAQYTIGNVPSLPYTPVGKEYVEAEIKKINKATMTITYETVWQTGVATPPMTFYFTQTFVKI
jgi:hypothetical protein